MNKETTVVVVIVLVLVALFGLFFFLSVRPTPSTIIANADLLVRPESHRTGSVGAKVTMVEFGDYECPACAVWASALKPIINRYKSNPDFSFVFRNFPLSQHPNALIAAEVAEAAAAQGKFWEMNDLLYSHQDEWVASKDPLFIFATYAGQLNLDVPQFRADVTANKYDAYIKADQADGTALALDHTPTIYLNGKEVDNLDPAAIEKTVVTLLGG